MSGLDDQGIAAAIGAVLTGAGAAAVELFRRTKRKSDAPEPVEPDRPAPSSLAARVGRLYDRVTLVEQAMNKLSQNVDAKLAGIEDSVDELSRSRVRTDELLPLIREQLKEIRDELHQHRRAATNKE